MVPQVAGAPPLRLWAPAPRSAFRPGGCAVFGLCIEPAPPGSLPGGAAARTLAGPVGALIGWGMSATPAANASPNVDTNASPNVEANNGANVDAKPTLFDLVETVSSTAPGTYSGALWVMQAGFGAAPLGTIPLEPLDTLLERLEDKLRPPPDAQALVVDMRLRSAKGAFTGPKFRHTLEPRASVSDARLGALEGALEAERAARIAAEARVSAAAPLEGRSITTSDPLAAASSILTLSRTLAGDMVKGVVASSPPPVDLEKTIRALGEELRAASSGPRADAAPVEEVSPVAAALMGRALDIGDVFAKRYFDRLEKKDEAARSDARARETEAAVVEQARLQLEQTRTLLEAERTRLEQERVALERERLGLKGLAIVEDAAQ